MTQSDLKHGMRQLTGLELKNGDYQSLLREFNNWEMPLSQRIKTLDVEKF